MSKVNKMFEEDNNNPEIQAVKKTMKDTKQKRMFVRYQVILYHLKSYTNIGISKLLDLAQHTVGIYIKNYKQNGLDGLIMRHSPGATRMLTDEQEKQLYDIISTKTPDEVGFPRAGNDIFLPMGSTVVLNYLEY